MNSYYINSYYINSYYINSYYMNSQCIINPLRIPNQLQRNKRNLISLIYKKNLPIKTRIKVIDLLSIDDLANYLFSCCH